MYPLLINKRQYREMNESRIPKRTFFYKENDLWVGVDNRKGKPWEKKFSTMGDCVKWLKSKWI